MLKFKDLSEQVPPLDVKILIKKSAYVFDDGAQVVVFDSNTSGDPQFHVDYFLCNGLNRWLFVDENDDMEWTKERNKDYVANEIHGSVV